MNLFRVLVAAASLLFFNACASVVEGTHKTLQVTSKPAGALIKLDGDTRAITPGAVQVSTRSDHLLSVELAGYVPYQVRITRKCSPWGLGNVLTGGAPGVAFDAQTGAVYRLEPRRVDVQLQRLH